MSWIYIESADFTQGQTVVKVYDLIDLERLQNNWIAYVNDELVEIVTGSQYDNLRGYATIVLAKPWAFADLTGAPVMVIPTTAPLFELLENLQDAKLILDAVAARFPITNADHENFALIVGPDGGEFEAVDGYNFAERTGLLALIESYLQEQPLPEVQMAVDMARRWASELNFVEVDAENYPGLFSARHYAQAAKTSSAQAEQYRNEVIAEIAGARAGFGEVHIGQRPVPETAKLFIEQLPDNKHTVWFVDRSDA